MSDPLSRLTAKLLAFRMERDWEQFHNPKDLAAAIAIEAAEFQELFLWVKTNESAEKAEASKTRVAEEMADVLGYLLLLANDRIHDGHKAGRVSIPRTSIFSSSGTSILPGQTIQS